MTDIFYIAPAPKVTIPLASTVTGLTEKAIRCNIDKGVWVEGREEQTKKNNPHTVKHEGCSRHYQVNSGLSYPDISNGLVGSQPHLIGGQC